MKKIATLIIVMMCVMSLFVPMAQISACSRSVINSFEFLHTGHSSGSHFTTYQVRYSTATASIHILNGGSQTTRAFNGATAIARAGGIASANHTHAWGTW